MVRVIVGIGVGVACVVFLWKLWRLERYMRSVEKPIRDALRALRAPSKELVVEPPLKEAAHAENQPRACPPHAGGESARPDAASESGHSTPPDAELRREGHSALRWNKEEQRMETVDPHPPSIPIQLTRRSEEGRRAYIDAMLAFRMQEPHYDPCPSPEMIRGFTEPAHARGAADAYARAADMARDMIAGVTIQAGNALEGLAQKFDALASPPFPEAEWRRWWAEEQAHPTGRTFVEWQKEQPEAQTRSSATAVVDHDRGEPPAPHDFADSIAREWIHSPDVQWNDYITIPKLAALLRERLGPCIDKLQRMRDFLKYHANSPGGITHEIDYALARLRGEKEQKA